jgi:hypothetical protein
MQWHANGVQLPVVEVASVAVRRHEIRASAVKAHLRTMSSRCYSDTNLPRFMVLTACRELDASLAARSIEGGMFIFGGDGWWRVV